MNPMTGMTILKKANIVQTATSPKGTLPPIMMTPLVRETETV